MHSLLSLCWCSVLAGRGLVGSSWHQALKMLLSPARPPARGPEFLVTIYRSDSTHLAENSSSQLTRRTINELLNFETCTVRF